MSFGSVGHTLVPVKNSRPAIVDASDLNLVSGRNWYAVTRGNGVYAESASPTQVLMHRLIAGNVPHGMVVDHVNRDPLDNRRANLRICTQRENARNRAGRINSGGYKGVQFRFGRWRARIMVDGREIHLGTHDTAEAAAAAYNVAAVEHFGEFAKLNVIATGTDPAAPARKPRKKSQ